MTLKIEVRFDATGLKAGIVASRFNEFIVSRLIDGALDALVRHGVSEDDITIVRVPGAFEIPQTVRLMARSGKHDLVIAIGAVIRGATPHFDFIGAQVAKGLAQLSMESSIPIGFGVLTTDTIEQAVERAGSKVGNRGAEAAMAAIEMANLFKQI